MTPLPPRRPLSSVAKVAIVERFDCIPDCIRYSFVNSLQKIHCRIQIKVNLIPFAT